MKYDPIMCMMVDDSVKTKDESYVVRGRKYKVLKRDGDNVTVKGPDGKVTKMHIDFLMSEGKKVSDKKTIDKAIRACDSRVSTRNVVTSNIAFEEIKKMTGIIPEKVQQKGDVMEFYHSGVKVAEWDMNNAEVKVFV